MQGGAVGTPVFDQNPASIPNLVRNATDSLVELVAAHLRLANLELVADFEAKARQLVLQGIISLAAVVGYGLLMVALGLAAGAWMDRWAAFLILGGVHLAAAGIAAGIVSRNHQRSLQMERAIHSVGESMTVVADAVLGSPHRTHDRN